MQSEILGYDEFSLHVLRTELLKRVSYKWKCKNGSIVDVEDMSTSHVIHAINMLEEYLEEQKAIAENFLDALDYYD